MPVQLFLHNQTAYQNAVAMMREQGKAAVIHPTGTGKSFIAFKLAGDNPKSRICWLAPSEYIFQTQRENFLKAGGREEEIANILFLTYARLMWDDGIVEQFAPDYIVLDEFHRCGASEWGKGVAKLLAAYPQADILGLSATNVRYLDNQRDMADELFEGRVASRMNLGEAIAKGILPMPVYVAALYSYGAELKKMQRQVEGLQNPVQQKKCENILKRLTRSLQNADGPDAIFFKYMEVGGKYLVFCANKEHMDEMRELAGEWFGKVDSEPHIYEAYYDNPESREQFRLFCEDKGEHLKLLYCIDMLNEGVHVADVDGVVLLRPTISPILYLQQIGRVLVSTKEKQPMIFDMVNNFDGLYSIDSLRGEIEEAFCMTPDSIRSRWQERFLIFDEVRECRALFEQLQRNLSDSWECYYCEAENYYQIYHNLDVPKRYITETGLALGNWVVTQRRVRQGLVPGNLTKERITKLDLLGMRWESYGESQWMEGYRHLLAFRETYGHVDVAARFKAEDSYPLGRWLNNQRTHYMAGGKLMAEQIRMLEEAGVVWDMPEAEWHRYYSAAEAFYRENGHLRIPAGFITEEGLTLGSWISAKRSSKDALSEDRKAALDKIGMVWETYSQGRWNLNFSIAQDFYREHGHLNVPKDYESGGVKLGRWICRMRERGKAGAGNPLTEEQIESLDAIGMVWDSPWDIRFQEAREYYESHGDLQIPRAYITETRIWLGKWVYEQKKKRGLPGRRGLTEGQVEKLESIGMMWD